MSRRIRVVVARDRVLGMTAAAAAGVPNARQVRVLTGADPDLLNGMVLVDEEVLVHSWPSRPGTRHQLEVGLMIAGVSAAFVASHREPHVVTLPEGARRPVCSCGLLADVCLHAQRQDGERMGTDG